MINGFHLKDGLIFTRELNGDVTIRVVEFPGEIIKFATRVDGSSWASVPASMSKLGETRETWLHAVAFHEGKVQCDGK